MAATTNSYVSYLEDKEPFFVLRATADRIRELTEDLAPEQTAVPPQPGKWSIHEIVAHLVDVELVFQTRARFIMFQDNPPLPSFDQDRWVLGWAREQEPWDETFERFRVLRRSLLRLFDNAQGHDLERYGTHSERGPQTISDYVKLIAGHDLNHLQQIERIRAGFHSSGR